MTTARHEEIVHLLTTFYHDGRVPCADALPLHIALDSGAAQVRLRGERPYAVVFPEANFVQMIERSGVPPTETLIRVWLSTVYFDPHIYSWAHRIAVSETTAHQDAAAAR